MKSHPLRRALTSACLLLAALALPRALEAQVISDTFTPTASRPSGSALNGQTTEVGGKVWAALGGVGLGSGGVTNLNTVESQIATIPFEPLDYFTKRSSVVEADIDPAGSSWVGIGFTRTPKGPFWSDAQVWAYLWSDGRVLVRANGTQFLLYASPIPAPGYVSGKNHLRLEYDRISRFVTVTLNGTSLPLTKQPGAPWGMPGFTPQYFYAGVHAFKNGGYAAAQTLALDNFKVSAEGTAPAGIQSYYVNAFEDATVVQDQPAQNFGSDTRLGVRDSVTGFGRRTYLKFRLPPLPANIYDAILWIQPASYLTHVDVYKLSNVTWSESTLTWNNHLPAGATYSRIVTLYDVHPSGYLFGQGLLSSYLPTGGGEFTWALASTEDSVEELYSRETGYPVWLEVKLTP